MTGTLCTLLIILDPFSRSSYSVMFQIEVVGEKTHFLFVGQCVKMW